MSEPREHTAHQQKIIKRYYDNREQLAHQRLAELVAELYLAEGKKKAKLWQQAAQAMEKLGIGQARIEHLLKQQEPALIAALVQELEKK